MSYLYGRRQHLDTITKPYSDHTAEISISIHINGYVLQQHRLLVDTNHPNADEDIGDLYLKAKKNFDKLVMLNELKKFFEDKYKP